MNVEPVEADRARLAAARPGDTTLGLAVAEKPGFLPFYVFAGTGLSTLSRDQAEEHVAAGLSMQECVVEVRTIAEICRQFVSGEIHFLKIDIEGGERSALAGADFRNFRPWIVLVEATRPNSQEATHNEWEWLLTDAAYRFVYFDGLNRFMSQKSGILNSHLRSRSHLTCSMILSWLARLQCYARFLQPYP